MALHEIGTRGRTGGRMGDGPAGPAAIGIAAAALVATLAGPVPAGSLRPGDAILTRDGGYLPLLWAGHGRRGATGGPGRRPVALLPDALGPALPQRPLWLGAGHGVLVDATALAATLGTAEALAPAGALAWPDGPRGRPPGGIVHILLETHALILVEGAWVESLSPAAALAILPRRAAALADRPGAGQPLRPWIARMAVDAAPAGPRRVA